MDLNKMMEETQKEANVATPTTNVETNTTQVWKNIEIPTTQAGTNTTTGETNIWAPELLNQKIQKLVNESGNFNDLPDGTYLVLIQEAEIKNSNSAKAMLKMVFKVLDGDMVNKETHMYKMFENKEGNPNERGLGEFVQIIRELSDAEVPEATQFAIKNVIEFKNSTSETLQLEEFKGKQGTLTIKSYSYEKKDSLGNLTGVMVTGANKIFKANV